MLLLKQEEVTLKLAITEGGSSTGVKYIAGKAYLTSVAMTCAVGEVLSAQVAFQSEWSLDRGVDMSVYMGEDGGLLIKRTAVGQGLLRKHLDPGDVSVDRRRFSFDFPVEALITGDRIEIYTADGSNLELVDGHDFPDGLWHCHIDDAGGVRLYDEFEDAINGGIDNAVELIDPSVTQQILVRTRNSRFRCYAQMRSWEITTNRQQVDTTTLGEEFVTQFARGLISGQGAVTCIWDYRNSLCDPMGDHSESEMPHYLCELLLRLKQGALFRGQFYLHKGDPSVWYEAIASSLMRQ